MTIKKHRFIVDIFVLHLIATAEVMVHLNEWCSLLLVVKTYTSEHLFYFYNNLRITFVSPNSPIVNKIHKTTELLLP